MRFLYDLQDELAHVLGILDKPRVTKDERAYARLVIREALARLEENEAAPPSEEGGPQVMRVSAILWLALFTRQGSTRRPFFDWPSQN